MAFSEAEALRATTLEDWLPSYRLSGPASVGSDPGLLPSCDQVVRPAEFSGLGTLSVLTFALDRGLGSGEAVSVVADGEVVYASGESLYVATNRWSGASLGESSALAPQSQTTEIHKFDIRGSGAARHVASGSVKGHLLNQFSMSEHDGFLRLATTGEGADESAVGGLRPPSPPGPASSIAVPNTESFVSVSADREGRLVKVGEVGGLVAYLHPIGDGLILGVGQDASEAGRRLGSQMSLFDVSDPARPLRLHQRSLGVGSSEAEFDHHAFLWWAPSGLAVLPIQTLEASSDGTGQGFSGAVGLAVDPQGGIDEVGRLSHPASGEIGALQRKALAGGAPIRRSLVIGESLYTVSDIGILSSALGTLEPKGLAEFR